MKKGAKKRPRKVVVDYEKARDRYMDAAYTFEEDRSVKNRKLWQRAMLDLLQAYSRTTKPKMFNPAIPLDWIPLSHLTTALNRVVEGKDPDLFLVDPSDKYDSAMVFAKQIAVGYIEKAETREEKQLRKGNVIEWYGISRSTLNEWIRALPSYDYDEETDDSVLSYFIDYYRNNKLTGRRRRN